jgi:hypothetical protein
VKGMVRFAYKKSGGKTTFTLTVPEGTEAVFYLPVTDAEKIKGKKEFITSQASLQKDGCTALVLPAGKYKYTIQN